MIPMIKYYDIYIRLNLLLLINNIHLDSIIINSCITPDQK